MILSLIAAASAATQPLPSTPVGVSVFKDASHAIEAGRLEEAKLLIARAVAAGFTGPPVQRLTADLDFASGRYADALAVYQRLAGSSAKRASDCEKGAVSALEVGRTDEAKPLVDCAVSASHPTWRAWNAKGVLADFRSDWAAADDAYAHAHQLSPKDARIINNQGWSKLLRGEWAAAVPFLEQAAVLDSNSPRIANNLELARAALAADLPRRRAGESERDWAMRLNDAGVAAELLGDRKRAVAAFTQALDANPSWSERASNNLKALSQN